MEEEREFEAWLEASQENAQAYAALQSMWADLEAVADARLARDEPLAGWEQISPHGGWRHGRNASRRALLAGGAMSAAVLVAVLNLPAPGERYRTAIGERRRIELADGSILQLNTASEAIVEMSRSMRLVRLLKGQASFSVSHDSARPFVVAADGAAVVALGTEFDIFTTDSEVRITLVEGAVRVASGVSNDADLKILAVDERPLAGDVAELRAGEQVSVERLTGSLSPVFRADVDVVSAWRAGKVIFRNVALSEAVAEMNRYSTTKIRLSGEELGELRISGAFGVDNADHFLSAVVALFALESRRAGDVIILQSIAGR